MVDALSSGVCSLFSLYVDVEVSLEEPQRLGEDAFGPAKHAGAAVS